MTTVWERAANYAFPEKEVYAADPVLWAKERAGIELWSKQRNVIESVRDNPETAVHSCHNAGKSMCAAATCCWWLDVHPPGSAFIVTTAPTGPQIKAILWREIGRLHKRAELPGRTNLTEWYIGEELVGYGRKPNEYTPDAFQGIHAEFVLVVLDEASAIPSSLWDAASSLTSNEGSRTLAIGNPDDPHSRFATVCKPNSGWNVIHIGWEHTPNATGEEVPAKVRASLISKKWADAKATSWGAKSAIYTSKVKGLFPTDADKGTIPWSWAVACRSLQLPPEGIRSAGLDVGGGGDRTVLRERIGPVAGRERVWVESDPMVVCGAICATLAEWETQRVVIDVIGIGWALAGRIQELSSRHSPRQGLAQETTHAAEVVKFNAAENSKQPKRFFNKRAELYWEVGRELSRLQLWDLEAVDDDTMAELCEPEYKLMDSNGRVRIEPKKDVIKRLGRSPDASEALLMSFWEQDSTRITAPVGVQEMVAAGAQTLDRVNWAGPQPAKPSHKPPKEPDRRAEDQFMRDLIRKRPI